MVNSLFLRLFGGVPLDWYDEVPLIPFGQWLLPIGIFLLIVGIYAEKNRRINTLSAYRYRRRLYWWIRHFAAGVFIGLRAGLIILLSVLLCDFLLGNILMLSLDVIIKISLMWMTHSLSMAAIFVLLDLFPVRRLIPGFLLLLEGITFIIGFSFSQISSAMYGMWGMYMRSSLVEGGGFPAGMAIAVELILIAAAFLTGCRCMKNEENII